MLNEAIDLATRAHKGQVDKGGNDYIEHPLAVMHSLEDEHDKIVGVLHDVIEDHSEYAYEVLTLIGSDLYQDLLGVTRREGEVYMDFILRAKERPRSRRVKIADLKHNLDPKRARPELAGIEKRYQRALSILMRDDG